MKEMRDLLETGEGEEQGMGRRRWKVKVSLDGEERFLASGVASGVREKEREMRERERGREG